jgi:hypothetical protein
MGARGSSRGSAGVAEATGAVPRRARHFSDTSRAVALATCFGDVLIRDVLERRVRLPTINGLRRMAQMLRVYVGKHPFQPSGADRCDAVSLRPFQQRLGGRGSCIDAMRGAALHALEELWDVGRGMQAHEHMDVSRHDTKRQNSCPSLSGNDRQVFAEIQRAPTVERSNPISCRPDEVYMQAMMHHHQMLRQWGLGHGTFRRVAGRIHASIELAAKAAARQMPLKRRPPLPRSECRFSDTSRAVALATCSFATCALATCALATNPMATNTR